MPSFGPNNQPIYGEAITLAAAGTRTAAGNGGSRATRENSTLRLALVVTAASGTTPTLNVTVEHSSDGTTWTELGTFPQVTAAGTTRKTFGGADNYVRAVWAVAGTNPSFGFSVTGAAV